MSSQLSAAPPAPDERRCAALSRFEELDPVGTAGSYQGYALVDVALPWPADVGAAPEARLVQDVLAGTGIRLQATVPVGPHRVVLYRGPTADRGAVPHLVRTETPVEPGPGGSAEAVGRLLAARPEPVTGSGREVIVCTHGRRDVCCGAQGSRLHQQLVMDPRVLGVGTRARRTSHTGGHRFAPTAVVFPEATSWAYLDAATLGTIVARSVPVGAVLGRYRGWSGMGSPRLQALERAVLAEVGWDLLDQPRWGEESGGEQRLSTVNAGGSASTWTAVVEEGRRLPRPECGEASVTARKSDVELVVRDLRRA